MVQTKRIRTVRQYSGSLAHPRGMYYNGKEGRKEGIKVSLKGVKVLLEGGVSLDSGGGGQNVAGGGGAKCR